MYIHRLSQIMFQPFLFCSLDVIEIRGVVLLYVVLCINYLLFMSLFAGVDTIVYSHPPPILQQTFIHLEVDWGWHVYSWTALASEENMESVNVIWDGGSIH